MTSGLHTRFQIYRDYIGTNNYGEAVVVSGAILHNDLLGRIDYYIPRTMQADQQGIETNRQATIIIKPVEIVARPQDKIIITRPANHPDYNRVFRINGIEKSSIHPNDRRSFFTLDVLRTEEMRSGSFSLNA